MRKSVENIGTLVHSVQISLPALYSREVMLTNRVNVLISVRPIHETELSYTDTWMTHISGLTMYNDNWYMHFTQTKFYTDPIRDIREKRVKSHAKVIIALTQAMHAISNWL